MNDSSLCTIQLSISGAVQGVGFRPFIYRLAKELQLSGWICNSTTGVVIDVEGTPGALACFVERIQSEKPPHTILQSIKREEKTFQGYGAFEIRSSKASGGKSALVLPDIATCPACLQELFNPEDRRYLYPFINCTHCGPRFSIIENLPYDRALTTMKIFPMCADCGEEYGNPVNRRFHAQPNACPDCGPHVELWNNAGEVLASHHEAITQAVALLHAGRIVAIKGIGGFHLCVDASLDAAIQTLRQRKRREEKPLALLAPSIESIREMCVVSEQEEALLQSPAAPIVLLEKRSPDTLSPWIAPGNPNLGVMLPYSPLHHVLLRLFGTPLVATSGNVSDEPICIDEQEALHRLWGIADFFLVHNRPILRPVDDSVVRVMLDRPLMLRRARGYAPLPVFLDAEMPPILAVGPHLKNTSAVSMGTMVFLSQHIGDLETAEAYHAFTEITRSLPAMYDIKPEKAACDLHPDYSSTRYAQSLSVPVIPVQHHHAHIVSCMADNALDEPVLGVAWDGTGYGTDGAIWGSEFLLATRGHFTRMAHFRAFPLPSGDKASREPRRAALGLLYAMGRGDRSEMASFLPDEAFSEKELTVLWQMLQKNLNTPLVCSAGRLFDAVASLLGVRQRSSFEGQAAIELEYRVDPTVRTSYPFQIHASQSGSTPLIIDWEPIILSIVKALQKNTAIEVISTAFHNTLVEIIVEIAKRAQQQKVVLSGGCFQNRYVTEQTVLRLRESGFSVFWHKDIPPNDGGIALGQVVAASRME